MGVVEFENGFNMLVTETLSDVSIEEIEEYFGDKTVVELIKDIFDMIPSGEEIEMLLKEDGDKS